MIYRFGDYEVDAQRLELRRKGADQTVEPLVLRLLQYLIEHRERAVTRAELFATLWGNRVVADSALYSAIKAARAAIGDDGDAQAAIRTVNRTGYQFVAPIVAAPAQVEPMDAHLPPPASPAGPHEAARQRIARMRVFPVVTVVSLAIAIAWLLVARTGGAVGSVGALTTPSSTPAIAVLPFADLSSSQDQQYFADGLAEEIRDRLSGLPGLRVFGRTSTAAVRGRSVDLPMIARQLEVGHLLEGSVARHGDRVRIFAHLVDAQGRDRWSQTYDRPWSDLFAIQNEVAQSVAAVFSVTMNAAGTDEERGGTSNADAYEAYLTARARMVDPQFAPLGDLRYAIGQLERAVELDPQFALAWAWLSLAGSRATNLPERGSEEWRESVLRSADQAIALAPDLPWALVALSGADMIRGKWAAADASLRRARELAGLAANPWGCSGFFYMNVGQPHEALVHQEHAYTVDPLLPYTTLSIVAGHLASGGIEHAQATLDQADVLSDGIVHEQRLVLALARNDRPRVRELIAAMPARHAPIHDRITPLLDRPEVALAWLHDQSGHLSGQSPVSLWWHAVYAAYLGDDALALTYLRETVRDPAYAMLLWQPHFKQMRRLPAFKDLVRELKLVDYWRASGNWGDFCRPMGNADFECG